jgi:Asp-tRNA(Asn)/Glu-tRNA(Gln) amidotransferase A subunit family amidase
VVAKNAVFALMTIDGELVALTATEAAAKIHQGSLSAEEYTRACLDRIEGIENRIHAFAHLDPAHALGQARALDERRRNGLPTGPLHGIPLAIKDIIDTVDYATECGSPLFSGRRARHDATIVARMRAAGAVIIGKSVTTEFAFYHPGPTRNPRDLERTPGGSSSGSAAAVAAGMVPLAIGTQTNGSVIRPAAFCGVFGAKPSHGFISRAGMLEHSPLLDQPGIFARTLADLALLLDVIVGYDPKDSHTRPVAAPSFRSIAAETPPLPPRFAFMRTPIWDQAEPGTREAFETLVDHLGERVETVELPDRFAGAWKVQRTIMAADMAHRHSAIVERGGEAFSKTLRDFLAEGRKISAVDYFVAVGEARLLGEAMARYFDVFDAIITPATKGVAPKGLDATGDPAFCTLWTLLGLPALSVPILQGENDLPLGVQLIGQKGDDARLMRSATYLLDMLGKKKSIRRKR